MSTSAALRPYVEHELLAARTARERGEVEAAWRLLERAHILSQPAAWLHTRVHWAMVILALRGGDVRELSGQLFRLALAAIGSALGRFPAGNTGRARVSAFSPMEVPGDLQAILAECGFDVSGTRVLGRKRSFEGA